MTIPSPVNPGRFTITIRGLCDTSLRSLVGRVKANAHRHRNEGRDRQHDLDARNRSDEGRTCVLHKREKLDRERTIAEAVGENCHREIVKTFDEGEDCTGENRRQKKRECHCPEALERSRSEIRRGFFERGIEALQSTLDGTNHHSKDEHCDRDRL